MWSAANLEAWSNTLHSPAAWGFTFALAIVFPLIDWAVYRRARSKIGIYLWNIVAEWSFVAASIWLLSRSGLTLADIGESTGNLFRSLLVFGVIAVLVAILRLVGRPQRKKLSAAQWKKATAGVERLIPSTPSEQRLFAIVSLTAGICEEFLYRGWLMPLFAVWLGSWWIALLVSSVLFGFAHVYQGRKGVIGSTVVGIVFGLVVIWSRSLWPGQVLHAALDLNNGYSLGRSAKEHNDTE